MMLLTLNTRSTNEGHVRVSYSLYITLLQFSTGEYHPLAHCPRIDVGEYERDHYVILEVAGDNIALLIVIYRMSQLFIFDWKTGLKKLVRSYINPSPISFLKIYPSCDSNITLWRRPTVVLLSYHLKFFSYPTRSRSNTKFGRSPWKQMVFHIRC